MVLYRSQEAQNRLMATVLSPPRSRLSGAREQILVDEDLGFCEPILDRAAWHQRRELVLYVQHCRQGFGRDEMPDMSAAEARLITWTLD